MLSPHNLQTLTLKHILAPCMRSFSFDVTLTVENFARNVRNAARNYAKFTRNKRKPYQGLCRSTKETQKKTQK